MASSIEHKRQEIRSNVGRFAVYCLGHFLGIGSFVAVCGLQSSINIEGSVGTISLGIAYIISLATSLFITPAFIRRFGCKCGLLAGELSHLLFVAVNFYPASYFMVMAGAVLGIGEGLIWTALPMFSSYFGVQHGRYGTKKTAFYIRKYSGLFLGSHSLGLVFGFAVAHAFLYAGKVADLSSAIEEKFPATTRDDNITFPTSTVVVISGPHSLSMSRSEENSFEYCGSRDCQDPDLTEKYLHKYVPEDKTNLYILLGVFCAISLLGITLHICLLPSARPGTLKARKIVEKPNEKKEVGGRVENTPMSTITSTFRHIASPMQVLLVPLLVYEGLFYGFHLSELTRAFTACLLGVEKVGLCLMIFCTASALSSFTFPKLVGFFGRNKVMAGFFVLDMCNYIFCLFWKPQQKALFPVFIIFACFGITEVGWKNCAWSMYEEYFPNNQEIAMTVWNLFFTVGVAVNFVWSPMLCVSTKIYIQSTVLTVGVLGYGVADFLHRRSVRKSNNNDIKVASTDEKINMLTS